MVIKEDRRIQRTKKAFEDALVDLLKDETYEKITVSQIATVSGLSRATFYLHYSSKDELLEECLTQSLKKLKENAEILHTEFRFNTSDPHPLFIRIFDHLEKNANFYKTMLTDDVNSPITYSVMDIIESFIDSSNERMLKSGVQFNIEPAFGKAYFTHAFLGVITWWLRNDMPHSPKYMAEQLTIISTIGPYKDNPFLKYDDKPY